MSVNSLVLSRSGVSKNLRTLAGYPWKSLMNPDSSPSLPDATFTFAPRLRSASTSWLTCCSRWSWWWFNIVKTIARGQMVTMSMDFTEKAKTAHRATTRATVDRTSASNALISHVNIDRAPRERILHYSKLCWQQKKEYSHVHLFLTASTVSNVQRMLKVKWLFENYSYYIVLCGVKSSKNDNSQMFLV